MQTISEFGRQEVIDQTVAVDSARALKPRRYDPDTIMRAPALSRSRVAGMAIGLIDDFKESGIERLRQTRDDSLLHDQATHSR